MEHESGNNSTNIGYGMGSMAQNTTGSNCTAIGYSALGNPTIDSGNDNVSIGRLVTGLSSLDNFLTTKTLSMNGNQFIVKYNPPDSKWKIFNKGKMFIGNKVTFINCSSDSVLFEHENKVIGCFLVIATYIEVSQDNNEVDNYILS